MKKEEQKRKKVGFIVAIMLVGVIVNYGGRSLATLLHLPFWLDSIGTGVVACLLGPVYGAVCGVANNVLYGFGEWTSFLYGFTSIAIGLIVGISLKKGYFDHIFSAMTVSVVVAFASVAISTPLNLLFWQGATGNVWGDGLFDMLTILGWNRVISSILGQLFIDFPDKIVVILITYCIVHFPKTKFKVFSKKMSAYGMLFILLGVTIFAPYVSASQTEEEAELASSQDISINSVLYTQTVYNSENGLAAGESNAIIETPDGYIWIGTYAGLYRYDGRNFTMKKFDSIKNVNRLYVDSKGRLWIGTNDNGVSIYENNKITTVIDKSKGLPSNSVRCIGEDGKGNYYIGTSAALCIVSDNHGLSVRKTFKDIVYANSFSVRSDGLVSVVTNEGALYFIKDETVTGNFLPEGESVYYSCVTFDKKDELLVGTSANEVCYWDFKKNKPDPKKSIDTKTMTSIHSIHETNDGNIWICADNGIGYINENGKLVLMNTGTFNSSIDDMIRDYQGNLWFTSSRLGVLKLTQNSFTDLYHQCGLSDNVVNSVTMWKGKLYSGTDTGLDVIDLETNRSVSNSLTKKLVNNRIRCLAVDSKNHLWIATSGGIGLVEASPDGTVKIYGEKEGTIGERFRSVMELSDGTIVAAENTGIDFIVNGKVVNKIGVKSGLTNPQILSMVEQDDNTLLAGSDGDGIMIVKDGKVTGQITEEDGLTSGVILRLVKVDGGYFVVTSNSLCFMDHNYKIKECKNFPYSNNFDVLDSNNGKLWVLGSAGIYIVDKQQLLSGEKLNYELLDSRKGLKTSLTANSWNYRDGNDLYLSCNSGVYCINLNNYVIWRGSYRMMADYVDDSNTQHELNEKGMNRIPSNTSKIQILPELLNFTLNDPYVSYYLEGFDNQKVVVQQSNLSNITYTNLTAGTYVFHLSVLSNDGNKVVREISYTLEKEPRFWEHIWFMVYLLFVCVMGVVYLTWLVTVVRSNKIIEKQRQEIEFAKSQAKMGNQTILAIAKTVDAKDVNTSEHSERVSEYSVLIAKKLGWSTEQCENLRKVALLHDIGKIGIPDSILNKPARLTDQEYSIMKSHVSIGSEILKDFTIVSHVQDGVRYHHERYDGKGYVQGLKGEEIPIDARIVGIADAFDAMTSNRVYRKHKDMDYVISELKKGSGTQFDPKLVTIMLGLLDEGSIDVEKRYRLEENE